jgi:hypothetical protein
MKMLVFWVLTPCSLILTDVSEELTASVITDDEDHSLQDGNSNNKHFSEYILSVFCLQWRCCQIIFLQHSQMTYYSWSYNGFVLI